MLIASLVMVELPRPVFTAERDVLSKEATSVLSLKCTSTVHSSSKSTRGCGVVDPAITIRIVYDIDVNHSSTVLVVETELTAS